MKKLFSLSGLPFVFLAVAVLPGCRRTPNTASNPGNSNDEYYADKMASGGIMSKSDYLKLLSLDRNVSSGSKLSEADVDWLLSVANKGTRSSPDLQQNRQLQVSRVIKDASFSQLPQSRLDQIFEFAYRMANSSSPRPIVVWSGCLILSDLHNKKAVPLLHKLTRSNNPDIRHYALQAIQKLKGD